MGTQTIQALLLLAQAGLLFSLFLIAFRTRKVFGLTPLALLVGATEGLKFYTASGWFVAVPVLGTIGPASVVFFTASLAILLLVYIRDDASAARQLAWSLIFANAGAAVLVMSVSISLNLGASGGTLPEAALLLRTAWRIVVGTALLCVDVILVMLLYNQLTRLTLPFVLRVFFSLSLVCLFDTMLYEVLAGRWDGFVSEVARHGAGKVIASAIFALLIWAYLRTAEEDVLSPWLAQRSDRDLFAMLTYRERFEALAAQVIRDPLTGVFNRLYLDTRLPEQIALEKRRQAGVALLMVDVDHFKRINDTYGHGTGDEALRHLARVLQANVRRGDIVCRYGGEEFAVILPGAKRREAIQVAEHLVEQVRATPLLVAGNALVLTVTVGVAAAPVDGRVAAEILSAADACLYQGKRSGRNRVASPATLEPDSQLQA